MLIREIKWYLYNICFGIITRIHIYIDKLKKPEGFILSSFNINLRNKTIFITGVAGFIGSYLAKKLYAVVDGIKIVSSLTDMMYA